MVSSSEDPNRGLDVSVGGLVWVRRRNGSWWPGRILGMDELPEGCLSVPRSGTPVKLLGREDASVDWYNLEKSKRVKAFRCGEYDECIERVKASESLLIRKAVKYARREDAILHALELESARLGRDSTNLSSDPNSQSREHHLVEESPSLSRRAEEDGDIDEVLSISGDYSDSAPELSHSGVSFEEPHLTDATREEPKLWRTVNDSEDDGTEGVKRMRGLEDLGMGVSSSPRRKRSQAAHVLESTPRLADASLGSEPGIPEKPANGSLNAPLVAEEQPSAVQVCLARSSQSSHVETGSTSSGTADFHGVSNCEWQLKGKRNSRSRKTDMDDDAETYVDPCCHAKSRSGTDLQVQELRGRSWNPPHKDSDPGGSTAVAPRRLLHRPAGSGLCDIIVEVETSHQQRRLPCISLMSRSRGRPIIGQPVAIEVLEGKRRLKAHRKCRKARRKRVLSTKTRTLSSLTRTHRRSQEQKKVVAEKKVKAPPSTACVPLKVVFSRINAALNSPTGPVATADTV